MPGAPTSAPVPLDQPRPVDGYGPGFFRVAGVVHRGPVLLTQSARAGWGGLEDAPALLALAGTVDLLLIGTGASMEPLPNPLLRALRGAGLACEHMATPTACRSFNMLLSDGRRIALAALPVTGTTGEAP